MGKLYFLLNSTAINLDFKDMVLLLSKVKFILLGVNEDTNNSTVLLNSVKLGFSVLGVFSNLLLILRESLLLGVNPVLVETSKSILG